MRKRAAVQTCMQTHPQQRARSLTHIQARPAADCFADNELDLPQRQARFDGKCKVEAQIHKVYTRTGSVFVCMHLS